MPRLIGALRSLLLLFILTVNMIDSTLLFLNSNYIDAE